MIKPLRIASLFFLLLPFAASAQEKMDFRADLAAAQFASGRLLHNSANDSIADHASSSPSLGGAFLRSAVIPGWGQRRAGANTAARNFFVAEVLLWSGFASLQVYGHWLKNDYKLFAATHAGVELADKDDQFFVDAGNFISVDEFNQSRLRRRDVEGLYDPATHAWKWDTEANQLKFANLRKRSERSFSRSNLVVAGVLANHIISGIHAAWVSHKKSSAKSNERGELHIPQLGVLSSPEEIRLVARLEF
jgi:hypothetical protein